MSCCRQVFSLGMFPSYSVFESIFCEVGPFGGSWLGSHFLLGGVSSFMVSGRIAVCVSDMRLPSLILEFLAFGTVKVVWNRWVRAGAQGYCSLRFHKVVKAAPYFVGVGMRSGSLLLRMGWLCVGVCCWLCCSSWERVY